MTHTSVPAIARLDWDRADLWGPPRPVRGAGPIDIAWGLVWFLFAQVAVSALVLVRFVSDPLADADELATSSLALIAGLVSLWAVFAGYPLFVSWRHGSRSMSRDFGLAVPRDRSALRMLGAGVAWGLALRAASIGATYLAQLAGMTTGENSSWLSSSRAVAATVFLMVGAAVVGPIAEEIFFRGFVIKAITGWSNPAWLASWRKLPPSSALPQWWARARVPVAVVVSSVMFGFMHITGWDAAGAFVVATTGTVGLVFAVMTVRTGTLTMAIGGHVAFNASGVLLMLAGVAE